VWGKYRVRATTEAIVSAVTGPSAAPRTLPLARAATAVLGEVLTPVTGEHPWSGRTCTAGRGSRDVLDVTLVNPQMMVEVAVDAARAAANRWHHPVRLHRKRFDVSSDDVTLDGS
jgi:hypothetical protein